MNGRFGSMPTRKTLLRVSALGAALVVAAACSNTKSDNDDVKALDGNHFAQINIASNKAEDKAQFTFPDFINAWGIADRPKGAGGHFWVGAPATPTSSSVTSPSRRMPSTRRCSRIR
ncbi:hypothetical protein [Nocardia sp. NPDC005998]|uniref:hypothetical protein n=1 Tax=Nocardia sp. NPDC005998 TaxID=3156894 RepID=UPI0033BE180A